MPLTTTCSHHRRRRTPYGKTAQTAIAAVSRLAEVYDPARMVKLNSADITDHRYLPHPVVSKVLTTLSQAGIVSGSPGPGGGYWLARPTEGVTLYDVVSLFEQTDQNVSCPFGPDYCGTGPNCPLQIDEANENGGRDNVTAVVAQFDDAP